MSGVSLVAIQQQQQDQISAKNAKHSLIDIQREEEARHTEEEFMRWWNAEEERLRLEQATLEAAIASSTEKHAKGRKATNRRKAGPKMVEETGPNTSAGGDHIDVKVARDARPPKGNRRRPQPH